MMQQARIAEGKIAKLRHTLAKLAKDGDGEGVTLTPETIELLFVDVAQALREQHRYIELVDRECEQAKIQANRRRFGW